MAKIEIPRTHLKICIVVEFGCRCSLVLFDIFNHNQLQEIEKIDHWNGNTWRSIVWLWSSANEMGCVVIFFLGLCNVERPINQHQGKTNWSLKLWCMVAGRPTVGNVNGLVISPQSLMFSVLFILISKGMTYLIVSQKMWSARQFRIF